MRGYSGTILFYRAWASTKATIANTVSTCNYGTRLSRLGTTFLRARFRPPRAAPPPPRPAPRAGATSALARPQRRRPRAARPHPPGAASGTPDGRAACAAARLWRRAAASGHLLIRASATLSPGQGPSGPPDLAGRPAASRQAALRLNRPLPPCGPLGGAVRPDRSRQLGRRSCWGGGRCARQAASLAAATEQVPATHPPAWVRTACRTAPAACAFAGRSHPPTPCLPRRPPMQGAQRSTGVALERARQPPAARTPAPLFDSPQPSPSLCAIARRKATSFSLTRVSL